MKVIYMGTPALAVPCLEALHQSSHEITGVVTKPDRPQGRGRRPAPPPVKETALSLGLPLVQPESLTDPDFIKTLKQWQADLLVVVAFSILPENLLALCPKGAVNIHGSLLPKYRGAAPIQWAIANGETESGYTLFQLDAKMDHGHIIHQETLAISPNETAGEYGRRLMDRARQGLVQTLDRLEAGPITGIPQNHGQATRAPKLKKSDGEIKWRLTAGEIHNRIRGFNPYPMCYTTLRPSGKILRLLKTRPTQIPSPGPGHLKAEKKQGLWAGCGDFLLELLEVQLPGKAPVSGIAFVNGLHDVHEMSLA